MSVNGEISDSTELYCAASDVARYVRPRDHENPNEPPPQEFRDDDHADGPTRPTKSEVLRFIEGASVRIERKTQQAWRANRVTHETHDHMGLYYWLSGHPITLLKREVRPLDPAKGDKLEVYEGNDWNDWLQSDTFESGRDGDYWVDGPLGLLWIYERAILRPHPKFRITYRYGYDMVPHDIREAVAKRAAADIVSGDFYGTVVPGNQQGENADPAHFSEVWKEDFNEVAQDYKKVSWV